MLHLSQLPERNSTMFEVIVNFQLLNDHIQYLTPVFHFLYQEMLKKKIKMKRAQEGFPLLFVCVVSIVSMAVGYYIHP